MKINQADLVAVTADSRQYPPDELKEVAFAGRSNVGKSSLLNSLTNRRKLARTSGAPGKTRTINFYEINQAFRIVDLPGYGYAKVSKSISEHWGKMMERYFLQREGLVQVIQLVDIRHSPSQLDIQMYNYLKYQGLEGLVVATKSDKISRNHWPKHLKMIRGQLGVHEEDKIIPVSSLKKTGLEDLWDEIEQLIK